MPIVDRQKEREIVIQGRQQGLSDDQIRQQVLEFRSQASAPTETDQTQEKTGFFADIGQGVKSLGQQLQKRVENVKEEAQASRERTSGYDPALAFRSAGQVAGAIGDIAGQAILTGVKAIAPADLEKAVVDTGAKVLQTPAGQAGLRAVSQGIEKYEGWKSQNPELAKDLEAAVNIASLLPIERGISAGAKGLTRGAKATARATEEAVDVAKKVTPSISRSTEAGLRGLRTAKQAVQTTGSDVASFLKTAPGRIETNVAEKAVQRETIKSLPKDVQPIVRQGIEIPDVELVTSASVPERSIMKEMTEMAKKYEKRSSEAVDPAEIVGKELQDRVKRVDSLRKSIGKQQEKAVARLGNKQVDNVEDAVLERLRKVRGLEELRVDEEGLLDFSRTTLSGGLTSKDRNVIEKAYRDIFNRDATQLHKLRQELFEVTDGQKRAMKQFTGTQEDGLEAIRQGIADALSTISDDYKTLNQAYAQTKGPLTRINKFYKNIAPDATESLLNQRGASVARRLTSNAPSGQELSDIIRQLEDVLRLNGKDIDTDLVRLQEYLNTLNNYYDIKKKTGLAGQVELGLRGLSATDIVAGAISKATEATRATKAVKQKALDALLDLPSKQ